MQTNSVHIKHFHARTEKDGIDLGKVQDASKSLVLIEGDGGGAGRRKYSIPLSLLIKGKISPEKKEVYFDLVENEVNRIYRVENESSSNYKIPIYDLVQLDDGGQIK